MDSGPLPCSWPASVCSEGQLEGKQARGGQLCPAACLGSPNLSLPQLRETLGVNIPTSSQGWADSVAPGPAMGGVQVTGFILLLGVS